MENKMELIAGFGARLRTYLLAEKTTDKAFAEKIGRAKGVGYYEKNVGTLPKTSMLLAIMDQFPEWAIEYILFNEGEPYQKENDPAQATTDTTEDEQPGYFARLVYWMNLKSDVNADLKGLPIDGFKGLHKQLLLELERLKSENQQILNRLLQANEEELRD